MQTPHTFQVNNGWRVLLKDLGINGVNALRRAGLPEDLFSRDGAALSTKDYFRLWRGLEEEAKETFLPLKVGALITTEAFSPPVFAALCSPDLVVAVKRIGEYKRLIAPMTKTIEETAGLEREVIVRPCRRIHYLLLHGGRRSPL